MKKIIFIFLCMFNLSFSEKIVTFATDPFPPFHSPSIKDYGFFAEIVKEAFAISNYQLKIEFVPWNRAMEYGEKGKYDGVMGALYSNERAKSFLFSDSVYRYGLILYTNKNTIKTKEEFNKMKNLKLGQVKGYFYPLEKEFTKNYTIIESSSIENNLNALINKRVDFIIESNPVIENLISNKFKDKGNLIHGIDVFSENDFFIMISKKALNSTIILEDFNKGLKEIKKNGTYDKILKKYGIKNK